MKGPIICILQLNYPHKTPLLIWHRNAILLKHFLSFERPVKRDGASVVGEAQLRPYLALMAGEVEGDRMAVKIAHAPNNQCARFHFHKNFSFRILSAVYDL